MRRSCLTSHLPLSGLFLHWMANIGYVPQTPFGGVCFEFRMEEKPQGGREKIRDPVSASFLIQSMRIGSRRFQCKLFGRSPVPVGTPSPADRLPTTRSPPSSWPPILSTEIACHRYCLKVRPTSLDFWFCKPRDIQGKATPQALSPSIAQLIMYVRVFVSGGRQQ